MYEVLRATTPELLAEHYALRYRVFVEALGFEPANTAGLESDRHDFHAAHFIARHQGRPVGALRLIPPPMPLTEIAAFRPEPGSCEVSRLIVLDRSPALLHGLLSAAHALAAARGWTLAYFLARTALARILRAHGLPIERCGAAVEHHGRRAPYRCTVPALATALQSWAQHLEAANNAA